MYYCDTSFVTPGPITNNEPRTTNNESAADYELAAKFLENYRTGLRAGDALHLAIARNHGARMVYSLDAGLVKAATVFKISASTGMRAQLR